MIFLRIVLIILVPVLAMLVLAYTYIYTQKYYPKGERKHSEEEQEKWRHQKTLVDYLQSSSDGDLLREETYKEDEDGNDPNSG